MKSNAFFMVFVLRLFRAIKMVEEAAGPTTSWSLRRNKAVASAAAFLAV